MQFTRSFAQAQRRLLGESVSLVERDPRVVADEVERIAGDRTLYDHMAAVGRARMGPPGAGRRMAQAMGDLFGLS